MTPACIHGNAGCEGPHGDIARLCFDCRSEYDEREILLADED